MLPSQMRDPVRSLLFKTKHYRDDEKGSLVVFSLFIFVVMLMFGGIAVDLMLYENKRTHVQNSTDRAVLAAANLNQTVDPKVVVTDYLNKVGVPVNQDDIDVTEIGAAPVITGRQVAVEVNSSFDTLLMNLVGVNSLAYNADSEAAESVNDVEVSLILDISGSMGSNSKLQNMQAAAKDFVAEILAGASDDRVSLSLVPYSTQVNAGEELLGELSTTHNHSMSHCVNFVEEDFETTLIQRINPTNNQPYSVSQTAAFDPFRHYSYGRSLRYDVCRPNSYAEIVPWSNDITTLQNQIDDMSANGNTSIDVAVKWGAALLDPSMNGALNAMIADPGVNVDAAFSVRPHPYSNVDALKFIVVMTDGINTRQYRLRDSYKEGMSNIYQVGSTSSPQYILNIPGNSSSQQWWNMHTRAYVSAPSTNPATLANMRLSKLEMWSQMTMKWRAYNGWYRRTWSSSDYYDELYDPRTYVNDNTKDDRLDEICSAAKDQGVVIFTIGFEVTDHSADVMRSCASTPNFFYRVEGLDIEYAFNSIANQINHLKLTQ